VVYGLWFIEGKDCHMILLCSARQCGRISDFTFLNTKGKLLLVHQYLGAEPQNGRGSSVTSTPTDGPTVYAKCKLTGSSLRSLMICCVSSAERLWTRTKNVLRVDRDGRIYRARVIDSLGRVFSDGGTDR
jgi:hypothetical protein